MIGAALGIGAFASNLINSSKDRQLSRQQAGRQEVYNQISSQLNQKKFDHSKYVQQQNWKRQDNAIQRLVKDANAAGVSLTTALGGAGSGPASVSIPGHSTQRVAGNQRAQMMNPGELAALADSIQRKTEKQKIDDYNDSLFQQHRAQNEYYNMKNQEFDYNQKVQTTGILPNKYDLYRDNTEEAKAHIRAGGFAIPAGASMELPESIGAYQFGKPYVTETDFLIKHPAFNIDMGISP